MSDNDKSQLEAARPTLALNSAAGPTADPMQADEARMRKALGLYGDQPRPRTNPDRSEPAPRPAERFNGSGHKRRFVHDGEVPVTLVHGLTSSRREHGDGNGARGNNVQPTNRLEIAEAALTAEIATRERAERGLQEAQTTIHDLQTKLGHADLAHQEATETLRRERELTAELRVSLQAAQEEAAAAMQAHQAAQQALEAAEQALAEQQAAMLVAAMARTAPPADTMLALAAETIEDAPVRPRRGRKPKAQSAAAEPSAAPAKPRMAATRGRPKAATSSRPKTAAPKRESKPIRWWVSSRAKKKR